VWECARGGVRPPPLERVSRAAAEGRRAECVCEAESELESVNMGLTSSSDNLYGLTPVGARRSVAEDAEVEYRDCI